VRSSKVPLHTAGELFEDGRPWPAFQRWTKGSNHFLLYESDRVFRIIPKRILGEAQVLGLREALTANIGPAPGNVNG
jgi:hypothetical protein